MPNLLNRVFAAIFASAVCYGLCASSMAQSAGGSSELFPGRFFSSDPLQLTATSATPIRLGFADLDHDGLPEALPSSSTFSPEGTYVQHNDGASGFSAPVHIGRERLVDDLDHDGVSDLAFVEKTTGASVDVRLSNGSGGFGPVIHTFLPAVLSVGELSWRSAQVDADGHADLLVWGLWYLHVVVLRGDGQGGFTAAVGFPCIGNPADVQAIDANQDGALDLIVRCFGPDFFVLLVSNGQGGFASPVKLEDMSWGINDFALGDFDANGWIDVAASRPNNGARLHFATGPATFAPSVPIFGSAGFGPSPVGSSYSIHARDYDADGVEDVLVASASDTGWYRGVPAAMPAAFQSHGFALAVSYPRLADPDADGSEDWVVPFGNGFATADWKAPKPIDSTALAGASRLRATDLDHDGRLDLVGFVSQKLQVALGDGSGRFALHDEESLVQCHGLATLDADADGATDVIASVPGSPPSWTLYSGDGTGKLVFQAALPVPSGNSPVQITAGDFDGDGRIDVASLDSVPGSDSGTVSLGLGTGSGSFVALAPVPIPQLTLSFLEAGDFDQDGALDLIAGTEANDRFELLRLISAATVPVATSHVGGIGNGATLLAARVHDLNDDGWPDVVVGGRTWSDRRFWLVAGAPGANLAPPTTLIVEGFNSGATDRIWVEDLDRDGSAEIAGFGGYGIHTTVHQLVAGSWQSSASYVGWSAGPILADPDNDGDVDWIGPGMLKPSMLCVPNILHAPSGLAAYGAGTPSCDGQITSVANVAPKVGESQFKLSWTNAPPTAQALVGIAFAPDPAGSDVFGVGVKIHIGLLGPVLAYPVASDASGAASLAFPVPNVPELAGFKAYAQALWIEPAWQSCSSSPLPWSTSTGLEVTVLP